MTEASVGLWLYPLGLGSVAWLWTILGFAAILGVGLVAGVVTSRLSGALGSVAATVLGLAASWGLVKMLDPSRPEGENMVFNWVVLASLVGAMHAAGAVIAVGRRTTRSTT